MKRRTTEVHGFVKFPTESPLYRQSGEGGLSVFIVVRESSTAPDAEYPICVTPPILLYAAEVLVGPQQAEGHHFPYLQNLRVRLKDRNLSTPYLACILIGSTGWSGCDNATAHYWEANLDDLTEDGIALFSLLSKLFPASLVELLTWLDT